ncbi:MAG: EamA family transporter [Solirubrobacterales bacterium]|nr:EamA family transporter [Solirubrobacterales bacterium]
MTRTHRSIASVVLAGVLFGTAGTAGALGPAGTTPQAVGALRLVIGAITLLLVLAAMGTRPPRILRLWRSPWVIAAAAGAALYQPTFFQAVDDVGVGTATLLAVGSAPIFAGLLGWRVLGHRPTGGWVVATVVCIVGLALRSSSELVEGAGWSAGLLLALGAGLSSATWTVAAKHEYDQGANALELPAASFTLGGLLLLPMLIGQPLDWLAQPSGLALALYLGVATMAVANVVLSVGLGTLSPGPVTTLMLTDPLVATLLGVGILGEALGTAEWLGVALVFSGLVMQTVALARTPRRGRAPMRG